MDRVLWLAGLLLARLRRRLVALVGVTVCACLLAGVAGQVLSAREGQSSPIRLHLVITAPGEELSLAQTMAGYLSAMEDMASYCTFSAADPDQAQVMLDRGEATAVIALPQGFLGDVLSGVNTPPTLITGTGRPLESWLAGWLGESAAGLLTSAQAGIYAVLALYDGLEDPALTRDEVTWGINLQYISAVLNRQALFSTETVRATGALSVGDHYALGTLVCLLLLSAPLFCPLFRGGDLDAFLRRSRAAGVPIPLPGALALALTWGVYTLLFWGAGGAMIHLLGGSFWAAALPAACCGLAAAGLAGVCAVISPGQTGACLICLGLTGGAALAAGCLLPPALLPAPVRALGAWSPVGWMRQALAAPLGYPSSPLWPLWLAGLGLCLAALGGYFLRRRRPGAL